MTTYAILKHVSDDLLRGLPLEDQDAILAAVGQRVEIIDDAHRAFPSERTEIQWTAADGSIHVIWVDGSSLAREKQLIDVPRALLEDLDQALFAYAPHNTKELRVRLLNILQRNPE